MTNFERPYILKAGMDYSIHTFIFILRIIEPFLFSVGREEGG